MTWSNGRAGQDRICCKLDRVLINQLWLDRFGGSTAQFLPPGISDHSPIIVQIEEPKNFGPKPFKFFNAWTSHDEFMSVVENAWTKEVRASLNPLLRLEAKLKNVKEALRAWNKGTFGNVHTAVRLKEEQLIAIQNLLARDPLDTELVLEEKNAKAAYISALHCEEDMLRQKSRIQWLQLGDGNNKFFHQSVKSRLSYNGIYSIMDDPGQVLEDPR